MDKIEEYKQQLASKIEGMKRTIDYHDYEKDEYEYAHGVTTGHNLALRAVLDLLKE